MLELKFQYFFGHPMQRASSLGKTLMLGKIEGRRRRDPRRKRWLDGTTDSLDVGLRKLWEMVKDRETWPTDHGVAKSQTWLSNWRTTTKMIKKNFWGWFDHWKRTVWGLFPIVSKGRLEQCTTPRTEKGKHLLSFFLFTFMYSFFCLTLSLAVYDLRSPLSFIRPPNLYYSVGKQWWTR